MLLYEYKDTTLEVYLNSFPTFFVMETSILKKTFYIEKNNPALLNRDIRRLEAQKNLYSSELQNRFSANINLSYGKNRYARNRISRLRRPGIL